MKVRDPWFVWFVKFRAAGERYYVGRREGQGERVSVALPMERAQAIAKSLNAGDMFVNGPGRACEPA